jgi:hypothetical protein
MATDNSAGFTRRAFLAGIGGTAAGSAVLGSVTGWVPPATASTTATTVARVEAARSGFAATVSPDGSWQVTTSAPAWTFAGSVGVPVNDVRQAVGRDRIGPYQQIDFVYQADGARGGSIRVYDDTPIVLFSATNPTAAANSAPFPVFASYPQLPHQLSYSGIFGIYQFNTFSSASDSPWMYFDGNGDAFVLSAANHFEQAATVAGAQAGISCGVMSSITELPAGFTQQTILAAGHGIGAVHHIWGGALTSLSGKILPASDDGIVLNKLGYWTDHGATYYYDYESALGYTGTLKAVVDDWAEKNLPIGYMQLDSWWYPKGPQALWNSSDGEYLYEADSQLFPDGLAAFREQIGLPLLTHARWIDPSSPYQTEYQMSGGVVIDPRFWKNRMRYLRDAGVVSYEQDWLGAGAQPVYNLTAPDEFFGNMARYAAANGLTIEYCMPLPRNYLQTTLYDNVTHLRVSNDRFDSGKWDQFLYDSQLARSIGMWPWSDVFMSTETTNLLLSNLSAGPVGVGDPIGQESQANLMQVVRPDGVIVKPDVPIVPDDQTYLAEAADSTTPPMVASTYTDHDGLRSAYVFAYARQVPPPQQIYLAQDATLSGPLLLNANPGYIGDGYADYQNAYNDYVQWTVQEPSAGTYTLLFYYANGGSGNRPLAITVNGANVGTLPFAPTAGWSDWVFQGMVVQLDAGQNTIRATATGQSGGNINYLGISPGQAPTVPTQVATFSPNHLGVGGAAYVYDYFAAAGTVVPPGGNYSATVTSGSYYVAAPVGPSGIAFLGDAGKFVSLGKKRITSVSDRGTVQATVAFAPGEGAVTLQGYSPTSPRVEAGSGAAGPVTYDPATGIFSVEVSPGPADSATVAVRAG